jgi:hypothetical protein
MNPRGFQCRRARYQRSLIRVTSRVRVQISILPMSRAVRAPSLGVDETRRSVNRDHPMAGTATPERQQALKRRGLMVFQRCFTATNTMFSN